MRSQAGVWTRVTRLARSSPAAIPNDPRATAERIAAEFGLGPGAVWAETERIAAGAGR